MRTGHEMLRDTFTSMVKEHLIKKYGTVYCDLCLKIKPVTKYTTNWDETNYFCNKCEKEIGAI